MIEVGKKYIFKHCENNDSEWNEAIVTVEPGVFTIYNYDLDTRETFYNVIREDGLRGSALEEELIG